MGYKNEILRLRQGYPQDWIYIERKISGSNQSNRRDGVLAPFGHKDQTLEDLIKEDLLNTYNQKIATIRPIIGPNGSGKTTQLSIQLKKYLKSEFPRNHIYLFFDFRHLAKNEEDFWFAFIQLFYEQIANEKYLKELCKFIQTTDLKNALFSSFKNSQIVEQVYNTISEDVSDTIKAQEFFYGNKITNKDIKDFFFGFINLALSLNRFVIICFDEIQFLVEIDKSETLLKVVLEQYIRVLLESHRNKSIYLIFSCLDNPKHQEYSELKSKSASFASVIQNMEIRLGILTEDEKYEILDQVAEKIEMENTAKTDFMRRLGHFRDIQVPRILLQAVAVVLNQMGYEHVSNAEINTVYKAEARNYIIPILEEQGFNFISPTETEIKGYKIDIYATTTTDQSNRVKQAFGEVSIAQKKSITSNIEKFSDWLSRMKDSEYQPNLGDYAFFICPKDRITEENIELLSPNKITVHEFDSTVIDLINKLAANKKGVIRKTYEKMISDAKVVQKNAEETQIVKKKKYKLTQIPGIKKTNEKHLNEANIYTIDDLINSDIKQVSQAKRLGVKSLVKWIQAAKQISE